MRGHQVRGGAVFTAEPRPLRSGCIRSSSELGWHATAQMSGFTKRWLLVTNGRKEAAQMSGFGLGAAQ